MPNKLTRFPSRKKYISCPLPTPFWNRIFTRVFSTLKLTSMTRLEKNIRQDLSSDCVLLYAATPCLTQIPPFFLFFSFFELYIPSPATGYIIPFSPDYLARPSLELIFSRNSQTRRCVPHILRDILASIPPSHRIKIFEFGRVFFLSIKIRRGNIPSNFCPFVLLDFPKKCFHKYIFRVGGGGISHTARETEKVWVRILSFSCFFRFVTVKTRSGRAKMTLRFFSSSSTVVIFPCFLPQKRPKVEHH